MANVVFKAVKGNKAYTITAQEKNAYKAQGFDIYEGNKLVENGVGKSVTLEAYNALKAENDKLKKKNTELNKELKELKDGSGTADPPAEKD